jgi:sulfatase modifying factor 1
MRHRHLFKPATLIFFGGILVSLATLFLLQAGMTYTSTDSYCASCHVHPQATTSWEIGPHSSKRTGLETHCVDCHLPPKGLNHFAEKFKAGSRDLYGYYFTDLSQIDWEERSSHENALKFTFDEACSNCHAHLFPEGVSDEAVDAHLHYENNHDSLRCITCHLQVGHYHDQPEKKWILPTQNKDSKNREFAPRIETLPPGEFRDYTEAIPNLAAPFEMVAIPGGSFLMGSPDSEESRKLDEGPQRNVKVSPFWMGRMEVTWDEYLSFYSMTVTGRKDSGEEPVDAVTGPTPPYGTPDQGWGRGSRPAITMTHYAAVKYCEWLTSVTGRYYRLPTEAEWEYACRAGTTGPYFFSNPENTSWLTSLFGPGEPDPEILSRYAWHASNSRSQSHPGHTKTPNPFGLLNMLGNVREFCADWYHPQGYNLSEEATPQDPTGPTQGQEYVIRGGSMKSIPARLRSAARDQTRHDDWLKTDPQMPKSLWWYSDSIDVGFRVVREYGSSSPQKSHNHGE